jgi:ribosomal protein S27AE
LIASVRSQVFVRARCVPPLARRHLTTQPMQSKPSPRLASTYEGNNGGFRSSNIAACAQHGNASSTPLPQKPEKTKDQYCRMCGTQMELAIPKGEAAWRHMCSNCGYIDYLNPKMVRMAPGQALSVLRALSLLTFNVYTPFPVVLLLPLSCCHFLSYRL